MSITIPDPVFRIEVETIWPDDAGEYIEIPVFRATIFVGYIDVGHFDSDYSEEKARELAEEALAYRIRWLLIKTPGIDDEDRSDSR